MSTIPAGLRADLMRQRMEDKNTITAPGGLYVGGPTRVTVGGVDFYPTIMLPPGPSGWPLVSTGTTVDYMQLPSHGIANGAATAEKLGTGTIVTSSSSASRHVLDVRPDANDSHVLIIEFHAE